MATFAGKAGKAGEDASEESGDSEESGESDAQAKDAEPQQISFRLELLFCDMPCRDCLVLTAGVVAALLNGPMLPLLGVVMADMINLSTSLPPEQVYEAVTRRAEWMLVICAASLVFQFTWTTSLFWFAARQTTRLRTKYFENVLTRDVGWFDLNQPAALPARMVTDTKLIHAAIGIRIGEVVMNSSQFLVAFLAALIRGWELTLVVCCVIPVIMGLAHLTAGRIQRATARSGEWTSRAGAVTEESLLGVRTVAAFGGEGREVARLEGNLLKAKRAGILAKVWIGLSFATVLCLFSCSYALAFWYGAHHMIATNRYGQSEVISVVICVIMGVAALSALEGPFGMFVQAIGATLSMYSVINARPEIEPLEECSKEQPMEVLTIETIEFRGVHFSYPSRPEVPILQGLELCISRGQKVALVGETGSGKSTIVQLLERFYDPLAGGVLVNGVPLPRLPLHRWRRLLGYVGQEPMLFQCTVLGNIRLGSPEVTDEDCFLAARQAEAFDFVSALPQGFGTLVGVGGSLMSGGQKQRISIARALVRQPQLLILDEATSALDNTSEKLVQATLDQLQSTTHGHLTTLSVAHRLSTVVNSDRIFVFKKGRVAEQGSHAELMAAHGQYASLVQAQGMLHADDDGEDREDDSQGPRVLLLSSLTSRWSETHTELSTAAPRAGFGRTLCRLLRLSKSEWAIFPVALLSVLLLASQLPVQGLLLSRCFTDFSLQPVERMLAEIDRHCVALLLLGLVIFLGELGKHSLFGYIQQCLTLRLQEAAFAAMLRREMGFFDDPSNSASGLGSALARMTADVTMMVAYATGDTIQSILTVFVGIALGLFGSIKLTLVILAMMPLLVASMTIVARVTTDSVSSDANTRADLVSASAALNIRTLRAFNAEVETRHLFAEAMTEITALEVRGAPRKGLAMSVSSVMMNMVYLFGMWYGGHLIAYEGAEAKDVYQSLLCVTFGFAVANMAATCVPLIRDGLRSAGDLMSIIDCEPETGDLISIIDGEPETGASHPALSPPSLGDGTIEFQSVSFRFPHRKETRVLKCMSFTVTKGQTVALVGPSGSGKSTIIQLLLRFYAPTRGVITVGGMDLRFLELAWWRRQVGFVSQEPVLFDMSLEDNVKYGYPEATRAEVETAARSANMEYAFDGTVAWEDQLGLRGELLSGGQKQRCAIARAMVRCPEVLLLDEATSALDSASEHVVQAALDKLRRDRTTFTIAHRLSTVKDSDLILVITAGKIVERGTHDELLELRGWYAKQWHHVEA